MLTPIKRTGKQVLYIQVADAILGYIKDKKLVAGDKLPSERILSESLQISRNSVREALRFLETQGIITVHTGIGSFITSDCLDRSVSLKFVQLNYEETLEIKITLEVLLASKLVGTLTEEQLDDLDSIVTTMEEEGSHGALYHETDLKFHKYLYNLSPNATLQNMIADMIATLDQYWTQSVGYPEDNRSIKYHRDIVEGFRQKSFDLIEKSYKDMLDYDIKLFTEMLQNE